MAADAALRHGAVTLMAWPASEAFALGWLQRESHACLLVPLPEAGPGAIRYWPPSDVGRLAAESQGAGTLVAFSLAALQSHGQAVALEGGAPHASIPPCCSPRWCLCSGRGSGLWGRPSSARWV